MFKVKQERHENDVISLSILPKNIRTKVIKET